MSGKSKAFREITQSKTRELYEQGFGCRAIAETLGENPVSTFKRLSRMGLMRDKDAAYEIRHTAPQVVLPFKRSLDRVNLRAAAIGIAVRWFLDRGYIPSIPLEPTRYDLIVESDQGFKRVQVKTTNFRGSFGSWVVSVHRSKYCSDAPIRGVAGKRQRVVYTKDEVDLFFIVTGDGSLYLIPIEVVHGVKVLGLGKKYGSYKI